MGNEETDTPIKSPKSSSTQEQPPPSSPATIYPDWASYQAYYNSVGAPPIAPPAYFHPSATSSPQAHAYMWGQHLVPPYGTPPPYVTMYPPGGLYAHPSMPPGSHPYNPYVMLTPHGISEASVAATGGKKIEGKSGESKSKIPLKRSKGSLGSLSMLTGDDNEEKTSGACNGGFSQGGESGGRGSSEGSDGNSQNDSQHSEKGSEDAEAQNGGTACSVSSGVTEAPPVQTSMSESMILALPPNCVSGPATNLNIGVDYWGGHLPSTVAASRAKLPTIPARPSPVPCSVMGPHDGTPSELWMQDERELKRQKRKQSNRESARRSRMRKQAEYDELAQRVDVLKDENTILREELERLREDCKNLASENTSLTEKLQKNLGQDSSMDGDNGQPESDPQVSTNVDLIGSDC